MLGSSHVPIKADERCFWTTRYTIQSVIYSSIRHLSRIALRNRLIKGMTGVCIIWHLSLEPSMRLLIVWGEWTVSMLN